MADQTLNYYVVNPPAAPAPADAYVFCYEKIAGTWTQVDDGTWRTGASGSYLASGLTSGAQHLAVFIDVAGVKDTRVMEFTP